MRLFLFVLSLCAVALGFWMGQPLKKEVALTVCPEKDFPLIEYKPFVFVVYASNHSAWCERSLRSIFSQDYEHYRVVFVDDASTDGTFEKVTDFVLAMQQNHRVTLLRNEKKLGSVGSLYLAMDRCLDREIVIPLDAKDWLAKAEALRHLNELYQNPDVWTVGGMEVDYPSYEKRATGQIACFYAGLFKQIHLPDLFQKGEFVQSKEVYLKPLADLAGGRFRSSAQPLFFANRACPVKAAPASPLPMVAYAPLAQFPLPRPSNPKVDLLLFSYNRPLQLYACLESIQRYVTGSGVVSVLYRADDAAFIAGYERVKQAFPEVVFTLQSEKPKKDFKKNLMKLAFGSPSPYILFGVDDNIVKDFVDLSQCAEMLDRTGAYGVYLRLGKNIHYSYQANREQPVPPSVAVASGLYAWDLSSGQADWCFPNTLDLTVYPKAGIKTAFEKMRFHTPNSLEFVWARDFWPKSAVGLYFEQSKIINIPLNVVSRTGNPNMNAFSPEELLAKFNQGLKIDIEPLYQMENASPHVDYLPRFVTK